MEICAYFIDWKRFFAGLNREPFMANSDSFFRRLDAAEPNWIQRDPELDANTSAIYDAAIGEIFVELVDEDLLSKAMARSLGAFYPQMTELENSKPIGANCNTSIIATRPTERSCGRVKGRTCTSAQTCPSDARSSPLYWLASPCMRLHHTLEMPYEMSIASVLRQGLIGLKTGLLRATRCTKPCHTG